MQLALNELNLNELRAQKGSLDCEKMQAPALNSSQKILYWV